MVNPITDALKPPTDTLYKFLGILGLLILVSSYGFYARENTKFAENQLIYLREGDALQVETTRISRENLNLTSDMMRLMRSVTDGRVSVDEFKEEQEKLAKKYTELLPQLYELEKKARLQGRKSLEILRQYEYVKSLSWLCFSGLIIGLSLAIFGFYSWYEKHQKYQDTLIKNSAETNSQGKVTESA